LQVQITIPGHVQPKERPRATRTGHAYTPRRTRAYEAAVKAAYMEQHGQTMLTGPLAAEITVYMAVPASATKKAREAMMAGKILPTKRPDIDNCAKGILDALNGLAFEDDRQITGLLIRKRYDDGGGERAEVKIRELLSENRNLFLPQSIMFRYDSNTFIKEEKGYGIKKNGF